MSSDLCWDQRIFGIVEGFCLLESTQCLDNAKQFNHRMLEFVFGGLKYSKNIVLLNIWSQVDSTVL